MKGGPCRTNLFLSSPSVRWGATQKGPRDRRLRAGLSSTFDSGSSSSSDHPSTAREREILQICRLHIAAF